MRRCFGLTRNLRRCGRVGDWRFFCSDHRRQPLVWLFSLVFVVLAGFASIYTAWLRPSPRPVPKQAPLVATPSRVIFDATTADENYIFTVTNNSDADLYDASVKFRLVSSSLTFKDFDLDVPLSSLKPIIDGSVFSDMGGTRCRDAEDRQVTLFMIYRLTPHERREISFTRKKIAPATIFSQASYFTYEPLPRIGRPSQMISTYVFDERLTCDAAFDVAMVKKAQEQTRPSSAAPDVALRFVYARVPALVIVNRSASVARQIKWVVVLWNTDLPKRADPLPIPIQTFDWIRPHEHGGPENLFGTPAVSQLAKAGNHLLGSASVSCPDCDRGRTYLISIQFGKGGWFAELKGLKSGNVVIPETLDREGRAAYFKLIKATPDRERIPISDADW